MEIYNKFAKVYLKHLLITINSVWDRKKNLRYTTEEHLQSLMDDATVLHNELNGTVYPPELIKSVWSRASTNGFI